MKFKIITILFLELKKLTRKKKYIKNFYVKPKWITLIPVKNDFGAINMVKINNFVVGIFKSKLIKFLFKKTSIYLNKTYKFYFNFLKTTYAYNLFYFDKLKSNLYGWNNYDIKLLTLVFPFNSRYKFSYQKDVNKIFLTMSAGMLLKIFNNQKKSARQTKKTFKLGLVFLKNIISLGKKYFLIVTFRTMHKNLSLFLKLLIKYFDLGSKNYFCYFNYKKFYHFIYFKKKRSIKKKIQKRLVIIDKLS